MKLKSYFSGTVETALTQARLELGSEAMLVNSRKTSAEHRHLGEYEVVCAAALEPAAPGYVGRAAHAPPAPVDRLSQEVSGLKREMQRLASTLARAGAGISGIAANPALTGMLARLMDAELDAELAYDALLRVGPEGEPASLRRELSAMARVDASLGGAGEPNRIVALAGPPGAGKTTCLAKLAARFGLSARRPCQILSLDTHRIAAAEQLRSLAAILGVGFQTVESAAAMKQALEEHRNRDLVLIDTPGLGLNDTGELRELARSLSVCARIETQLVLPASMRSASMGRVIAQYEILNAQKLIFTRLDETDAFGPLLGHSFRSGKPISFLSAGQQIPEDLSPATEDAIVDLVLQSERAPRHTGAMAAA